MNVEEFDEDYFEPNFPLKNATNFSQKRDKHGVLIKWLRIQVIKNYHNQKNYSTEEINE